MAFNRFNDGTGRDTLCIKINETGWGEGDEDVAYLVALQAVFLCKQAKYSTCPRLTRSLFDYSE